jgi:hypothetical protein
MWRGGVRWVMLSFGWALACGGRYERGAPASDTVTNAGRPATSSGGATSAGSGIGGVPSGTGGGATLAGGAGVPAADCVQRRDDYDAYRSQVLAEFLSFPCRLDEDCRAFYDSSTCDPACLLIVSAAHRGIIDRLNTFENFNCDPGCPPEPLTACAAPPPVHCVSGQCQ